MEKLEKMKRLQRALENPKVGDLLLKVMNREITPQQAFDSINSNPDLKKTNAEFDFDRFEPDRQRG